MGPGLQLTGATEKEKTGKSRSKLGGRDLKDPQSTGLAALAVMQEAGAGRMSVAKLAPSLAQWQQN